MKNWNHENNELATASDSLYAYIVNRYQVDTLLHDLTEYEKNRHNYAAGPAAVDYFYEKFSISINEQVSVNEAKAHFMDQKSPPGEELKEKLVNLAIHRIMSNIRKNYREIIRKHPAIALNEFIEVAMPPDCWVRPELYEYESVEEALIANYSVKETISTTAEKDSPYFYLGAGLNSPLFVKKYKKDVERNFGIRGIETRSVETIEQAIKITITNTATQIYNKHRAKLLANLNKPLKEIIEPQERSR